MFRGAHQHGVGEHRVRAQLPRHPNVPNLPAGAPAGAVGTRDRDRRAAGRRPNLRARAREGARARADVGEGAAPGRGGRGRRP